MKHPLTETILIRVTPAQKAAYQSQGGAAWVRALLQSLSHVKKKGEK